MVVTRPEIQDGSWEPLRYDLHFLTRWFTQVGICARVRAYEISSYLASRIDDLRRVVLAFVPDDLAEGVLDGGVIALDEVPVDILYSEGGFAYRLCQLMLLLQLMRPAADCWIVSGPLQKKIGGDYTDGPAADNGDLALLRGRRHAQVGSNESVRWLSLNRLEIRGPHSRWERFQRRWG